jgi:hypothetical protein
MPKSRSNRFIAKPIQRDLNGGGEIGVAFAFAKERLLSLNIPMLCQKCGKEEATVHSTTVVCYVDDTGIPSAKRPPPPTNIDLCEKCAALTLPKKSWMMQHPMNNFTPRAQQVLAVARKEADRFHHNYVGTEHILLGLIKLRQGVAVSVLQKMGLDLETVRAAVERQVGTGQETKPPGTMAFSPRVKRVLALAGKEAMALAHSYVGTEHVLLGLLLGGEGVAARVLKSLDVDIEQARKEVLTALAERGPNRAPDSPIF